MLTFLPSRFMPWTCVWQWYHWCVSLYVRNSRSAHSLPSETHGVLFSSYLYDFNLTIFMHHSCVSSIWYDLSTRWSLSQSVQFWPSPTWRLSLHSHQPKITEGMSPAGHQGITSVISNWLTHCNFIFVFCYFFHCSGFRLQISLTQMSCFSHLLMAFVISR